MIGTSIIEELTTLITYSIESDKPLWLTNIKFYVMVTDMFHKYRIRSVKCSCKTGVLDISESFIKKVAASLKRDPDTVVFLWICKVFQKHLF